MLLLVRKLSNHRITRSIEYISQDNQIQTVNGTIRNYENPENRPLLVLLSWLLAERRHIMKFANLYMQQGFDVALVRITPWQLLWPLKGTRVSVYIKQSNELSFLLMLI